MKEIELNPEQEVMAKDIEDRILAKARVEARNMARLLASKENHELFGDAEFQLRDMLMNLGAQSLDAALEARKKKPTKDVV
jgi:hypothetical protein